VTKVTIKLTASIAIEPALVAPVPNLSRSAVRDDVQGCKIVSIRLH
jgi:hypothetical protein